MSLPRLWQDLTSDPFSAPNIRAGTPAINVAETKDAFEITAELPGVDEKDVEVSLDGDRLSLTTRETDQGALPRIAPNYFKIRKAASGDRFTILSEDRKIEVVLVRAR